MRWIPVLVTVLVLSGAANSHAQAQSAAMETGAFIAKLGADTLVMESIVRTPMQVTGEYVTRTPRAQHRSYTLDLDASGVVKRFSLITRALDAGPGPAETRSTIEFVGDSAITTAPRGDSTITTRLAAPKGSIPTLQAVMGVFEQFARQARAAGRDTYRVALVSPGATRANPTWLVRAGGDTMHWWFETTVGTFGPWVLRVDRSGRLLSFSGKGTPFQAEAVRVPAVDIAAARAAFGSRALGPLSARDTARAALPGAELWVDYSRPAKRGREIFGNIVPWNTVWRTGANAATQMKTTVDLVIGGAAVPAGTYSLWTLPTPGGWKLIINRQAGQWGTVYDPAQDLARVDMRVETLPQPVELFTVAFEPGAAGADLRMSWDRTRVAVPVRRKE